MSAGRGWGGDPSGKLRTSFGHPTARVRGLIDESAPFGCAQDMLWMGGDGGMDNRWRTTDDVEMWIPHEVRTVRPLAGVARGSEGGAGAIGWRGRTPQSGLGLNIFACGTGDPFGKLKTSFGLPTALVRGLNGVALGRGFWFRTPCNGRDYMAFFRSHIPSASSGQALRCAQDDMGSTLV